MATAVRSLVATRDLRISFKAELAAITQVFIEDQRKDSATVVAIAPGIKAVLRITVELKVLDYS